MLKKALITFVVGAFLLSVENGFANCEYSGVVENVNIKAVTDGDTVILRDGRKVRLLGVNTPELGRDGKADEPFAMSAKRYIERLLLGGNTAKLAIGRQHKDRFGRVLAHVYIGETNVSTGLLEQGLGFAVIRPPDLDLAKCYIAAVEQARKKGLGVWGEPQFYSNSDDKLTGGFTVLTGKLIDVDTQRSSWWLRLEGNAVLLLNVASQQYFNEQELRNLVGKKITVQGWLAKRRGKAKAGYADWIMSVYHPSALLKVGQ